MLTEYSKAATHVGSPATLSRSSGNFLAQGQDRIVPPLSSLSHRERRSNQSTPLSYTTPCRSLNTPSSSLPLSYVEQNHATKVRQSVTVSPPARFCYQKHRKGPPYVRSRIRIPSTGVCASVIVIVCGAPCCLWLCLGLSLCLYLSCAKSGTTDAPEKQKWEGKKKKKLKRTV